MWVLRFLNHPFKSPAAAEHSYYSDVPSSAHVLYQLFSFPSLLAPVRTQPRRSLEPLPARNWACVHVTHGFNRAGTRSWFLRASVVTSKSPPRGGTGGRAVPGSSSAAHQSSQWCAAEELREWWVTRSAWALHRRPVITARGASAFPRPNFLKIIVNSLLLTISAFPNF